MICFLSTDNIMVLECVSFASCLGTDDFYDFTSYRIKQIGGANRCLIERIESNCMVTMYILYLNIIFLNIFYLYGKKEIINVEFS